MQQERYTVAKDTLRVARETVVEYISSRFSFYLQEGDEIAYWRSLYFVTVPPEHRAASYRRASRSTTTTRRDRRRASSGGVIVPSAPPGGGDRQGDPGDGSSGAQISSRPIGFEGGSSS